jgi:hypothetical protein
MFGDWMNQPLTIDIYNPTYGIGPPCSMPRNNYMFSGQ